MLLPEWFGRLILFFATHTIYRIRVIGRENFPAKSGALLVCNHMSFVDVALLVASTDRPIRFLVGVAPGHPGAERWVGDRRVRRVPFVQHQFRRRDQFHV